MKSSYQDQEVKSRWPVLNVREITRLKQFKQLMKHSESVMKQDKNIDETLWYNMTQSSVCIRSEIHHGDQSHTTVSSYQAGFSYQCHQPNFENKLLGTMHHANLTAFSLHLLLPAYQPSSHHQTCLQHRQLSFPKSVGDLWRCVNCKKLQV